MALPDAISHAVQVNWTSAVDGLWQTPSNWSSNPALPGEFDDVLIDQPGTITVTLSSGVHSVGQLTAEENLTISGAAELVVSVGGGSIDGALAIPSGRLVSAGGTLAVNGAVNAGLTGLRALAGGTLDLPTLTAINVPATPVATFDARDANSRLDLSSVTALTGGTSTSPTTVAAINGGRVELESVTAITAGATFVVADGASAVVDLTALTQFSSDNQFSPGRLHAFNGGALLTPNLATLGRAVAEVRGATSSLNLQALTSADGASFLARSGGQIAPPLLTAYAAGAGATEFFSTGTGSLIDLSTVTTLSGSTGASMVISTSNNGVIDLSGVATITAGAINLAAGSGGVIDLSSLQSYAANNLSQVRRLRAESGGTVRLNSSGTTTVTNANVELVGVNSVITGQELELGAGATLAVNGELDADLKNTAGVIAVGGTPGTTAIDGDFSQAGAGTIQFQIGGLTPGTQFDRLVVNGDAQLAGTLHVSLTGGFTPSAGNSFEVLTAAGGISGTFNVTWSGSIPWDAVYDGDSVTLVPGFDADFNQDLSVDGDDLAEWKANFGTLTGAQNADGDADADGDVDGADFLQWQREVGATLPAATTIPEPAAILLACFSLAVARRPSRTLGASL
jgi:hypothetical protein